MKHKFKRGDLALIGEKKDNAGISRISMVRVHPYTPSFKDIDASTGDSATWAGVSGCYWKAVNPALSYDERYLIIEASDTATLALIIDFVYSKYDRRNPAAVLLIHEKLCLFGLASMLLPIE